MSILKFKKPDGTWESVAAIKGEDGKDGAIQYEAGDGIKIEDNIISTDVTKEYVNDKIGELADMGFTPIIVESLPTENIQTNTIYMVLGEDGEGENIYEEWMYINETWEKVGSTGTSSTNTLEVPIYFVELGISMNTSELVLTIGSQKHESVLTRMTEIFNECYQKGIRAPLFVFKDTNNRTQLFTFVNYKSIDPSQTYVHLTSKLSTFDQGQNPVNDNTQLTSVTVEERWLTFSTKWTDGVVNVSSYDYKGSRFTLIRGSDVLTKTNTTSYTPSANYHPATKKYVDDVIATIDIPEGGGDTNIVEIDCTSMSKPDLSASFATDITNGTTKTDLQNLINTIKTRSTDGERYAPIVKVNFSNGHILFDLATSSLYTSEPATIEFSVDIVSSVGSSTAYIVKLFMRCIGTWTDGIFTITSSSFIRWTHTTAVGTTSVLTKTNTTSYTPTGNYHPATKKYVDDQIKASITSVLEADY